MIRAALIALMASPAIAATELRIDLNESVELMPDGSPMIVKYVPNGRHQFRRFGHQCLENKLGGEIIPCLTQDELGVSSSWPQSSRAAMTSMAAGNRSRTVAASGGAHSSATHGTSSSWSHDCICDDDTPREPEQPKPVPLPGSLAFMLAAVLPFARWRKS